MKKFFRELHKWLGLVSGLFVFIIALTGALFAFQEEISSLPSYNRVAIEAKAYLAPSQLQTIAEAQMNGLKANQIRINPEGRSAEVLFWSYNPKLYYKIYLNPYSGKVLKVKDMNRDFFRIVMMGHYYLWLPPNIGKPLVGWATVVFLAVLIAGFWVWIPPKLKQVPKRLKFGWKRGRGSFRLHHDLHVVGGVYAFLFAVVFCITGLVWAFPSFGEGMHQLFGGTKSTKWGVEAPKTEAKRIAPLPTAIDSVFFRLQSEYPKAKSISLNPPYDSLGVITATAIAHGKSYGTADYRYFDQRTLQEVPSSNIYGRNADMNFSDKLLRQNYDIHTGGILGLFGKTLAFMASLFIAGLPITGLVIWWKKRKKKTESVH